jgi:hypothetical protein
MSLGIILIEEILTVQAVILLLLYGSHSFDPKRVYCHSGNQNEGSALTSIFFEET